MKTIRKFCIIVSLLLFALFVLSQTFIKPVYLDYKFPTSESEPELEEATVIRVVDGDTIVIDRGSGDEKVRLIGIDTPESVHPDSSKNTNSGKNASEFTASLLPKGTTVFLQTDTSDNDRYNRLLRYVWLQNPDSVFDAKEIQTNMLNAILIKKSYAIAKNYKPDIKYAEFFSLLEKAFQEK